MSSTIVKQSVERPEPGSDNRFDAYVVRQLGRTGTQVKLVDFISGLSWLAVVTLSVLLAVCVVDAWVFSIPVWLRLAILVSLCGYALFFTARGLIPLLILKINPAFSAQMIERSEPKLKNSLLNYLFLRARSAGHSNLVYSAVQQKAAQDLSSIAIESTIDRTPLIRIGFALVAVVAVCGLYKLLSPKDPVQSIQRFFAPLADVQPPSRIKIRDVQPGSIDVFFGQTVNVTAEIRGAFSSTPMAIVFSTDDGQYVNASLPLTPTENRNEYAGTLSPTEAGIQQSLTYRIVAGDGRSNDYRVNVHPSPTIAVSAVEVTPPEYTEMPKTRTDGQGEIEAIEGSRVRIEAIANMPVASASIEFLKVLSTSTSQSATYTTVDRLTMTPHEQTAVGEFQLPRLDGEPRFTHYRIRFNNVRGESNRRESIYAIKTHPDIAPEIVVLQPTQPDCEVPVDGKLDVKLRASDPDFKIFAIWLYVVHKGRNSVEQRVRFESETGVGNVEGSYILRPQAVGLKAGDEAVMYAIAKDNRHSLTGELDPNQSRSAQYTLKITAATGKPEYQENPNQGTESSPSDSPSQKTTANSGNDKNSGQNKDSKSGGDKNQANEQGSGENNPGGSGSSSQSDKKDGSNSSQQNSGGNSTSPNNNAQPSDASQSNSSGNSQAGDSQNQPNSPSKTDRSASQNSPSDNSSQPDAQTNAGGNSQDKSSEDKSASPNSNTSSTQKGGEQSAENSSEPKNEQPLDDYATDGERMQRLLQRAKDQNEQPSRTSESDAQGNSEDRSAANNNDSDANNRREGNPESSDSHDPSKPSANRPSKGDRSKGDDHRTDVKSDDQRPPDKNAQPNRASKPNSETGGDNESNSRSGTNQTDNESDSKNQGADKNLSNGNKSQTDQQQAPEAIQPQNRQTKTRRQTAPKPPITKPSQLAPSRRRPKILKTRAKRRILSRNQKTPNMAPRRRTNPRGSQLKIQTDRPTAIRKARNQTANREMTKPRTTKGRVMRNPTKRIRTILQVTPHAETSPADLKTTKTRPIQRTSRLKTIRITTRGTTSPIHPTNHRTVQRMSTRCAPVTQSHNRPPSMDTIQTNSTHDRPACRKKKISRPHEKPPSWCWIICAIRKAIRTRTC